MKVPPCRPLYLNYPSVRAVLDGRQTCVLEVVRPQPDPDETGRWSFIADSTDRSQREKFCWGTIDPNGNTYTDRGVEKSVLYGSPNGLPGDQLWVLETWAQEIIEGAGPCGKYVYRANYPHHLSASPPFVEQYGKWRASSHMPKQAARLYLEIKEVKTVRLHDLTDRDAISAGMKGLCIRWWVGLDENGRSVEGGFGDDAPPQWMREARPASMLESPLVSLANHWDTRYAKWPESQWRANPWVWHTRFQISEPASSAQ